MLQPVDGQLPTGIPNVAVSRALELDDRELGMDARGKNHILQPQLDYWHERCLEWTHEIPLSANSVTNTPPPAWAEAAPYAAGSGSITVHPWL